MRSMRLGCYSPSARRWWFWAVGLLLVFVAFVSIRSAGLLRYVGAAIAADFSASGPDEPDARRLLVSTVVTICYAIVFAAWAHTRRWSRGRLRKFWTMSTSLVLLWAVRWGLQLPWTWGLIGAIVVIPLAWFNLGGLLALQEAAAAERRQRTEQYMAARSAKRSAHKVARGAGNRSTPELGDVSCRSPYVCRITQLSRCGASA